VIGGTGDDTMPVDGEYADGYGVFRGGEGDDEIHCGPGNDQVDGGPGDDEEHQDWFAG
jgi:hypothetical protein